jgi:FlaA1/EpsC-like NDP-sugar epimerase
MTIPQACRLVIKAVESSKKGLYILDMGKKKRIIDLKEEFYPNYPTKIIGRREGELITEELMTRDELLLAKKIDDFYVL